MTTPTTMPATAVVASTESTSCPPETIDSENRFGVIQAPRPITKLSATAATIAQNTARKGDRPDTIRTATRTSET